MNTVLVTGAAGFLGYHVVNSLNALRIRPRVLEQPDARLDALERLDVVRCSGHLGDPAAMEAACAGADTLLHTAYKVGLGGGVPFVDEMRRINVDGTVKLLRHAAHAGVRRAVVTGSALAVGVNRNPVALDESADWPQHAFTLPYAEVRRAAEVAALGCGSESFHVISVCPAFTFGPDDPVGAPANALLRRLITGKLRATVPVGFACTDVRDFAQGMLLAAERGQPGRRYLLTGENVTTNELLERGAAIAGVRAPRFAPPLFLLEALVAAVQIVSAIRGRPAPVTREVLQIVGRYAWYDSSSARHELGWMPRPLGQTLADTIKWMRETDQDAAATDRAGVQSKV